MRRVTLTLFCLLWASVAQAQRIIYDGKRDATAQQTAAAAKEVTSNALFAAMLKNVDAQAKLEIETVTAFVQERMRARLNAFRVWQDPRAQPAAPGTFSLESARLCPTSVDCVLSTLRQQHQAALAAPAITEAELNTRLAAIKARSEELKAELKALAKASKTTDPFIVRAFAALEDPGGDILNYAQKIADFAKAVPGAKGIGTALTTLEEGLNQVLAFYKALEGIWRGQQAVSVYPASLRPPPQQIDLQLLAVEQAHIKTVARITARRQLEVGVALAGVETALVRTKTVLDRLNQTQGPPARPIEAVLRDASTSHNRDALLEQWIALHETASAIAQLDAAETLANLRLSDEERRYSIRRSAVNTTTYDLTIQAAVQRLALYWKGGIKPAEIAQLVFYITNSIAVPAIAIKQE